MLNHNSSEYALRLGALFSRQFHERYCIIIASVLFIL